MNDQATTEKPRRTRKAKAKPSEPTEYVVLEMFQRGQADVPVEVWGEVDRLTARGGNEDVLLRKWGTKNERTGIFKLVPARSWAGGLKLFEQTSMASEPIA